MAQIGKHRHLVMAVADAVLVQSMGGNLHDAVLAALFHHVRVKGFQLQGVRRGFIGGDNFIPDFILDGADKPHLFPSGRQNRFNQCGNGAFPFGAGNADETQFLGRIAVKIRRHPAVRLPGVRGQDLPGNSQIPLADNGRRSLLQGFLGEVMAVRRAAGDADKHISFPHFAGIAGHVPDFPVLKRTGRFNIGKKL